MVWEDWAEILRANPGRAMLNWGRHNAQCLPILAYVGPMLGPCWAYVGPMLAYVSPMLAHVEPSWELCWGHVWAIYVETTLRCQFFHPGPPPGAQNHVKTDVFEHCQDEVPCRRRTRNTVKKRCVLTPQAKYTINYMGFSGSGVVQKWTGGGSAAAPIRWGARGARSWPCPCRTAVLSAYPVSSKTPAFYGVFCCSHFSTLVA